MADLASTVSVGFGRAAVLRRQAFTSSLWQRSIQRMAALPRAQRGSTERAGVQTPTLVQKAGGCLLGLAAAALTLQGSPVEAAQVRLPPIDRDPLRCERAFTGNTIGQANAVSDKLLDLRQCDLTKADLSGKTLSGALLVGAIMTNTNMQEVVMSKAYAVSANFSGADMTNAVVDRVSFDKSDLTNVIFKNAIITGTTFEGADLGGTVFEEALIGSEDAKRLCANPTLVGSSRQEVGCRK